MMLKSVRRLAVILCVAASSAALAAERPSAMNDQQLTAKALDALGRKHHAKARLYLRELASRDVPAAATLLGTMTMNGEGGPAEPAVAVAWFMRAARKNHAPAQIALSHAFANGIGVPRNRQRADALAQAAAVTVRGTTPAMMARHELTALVKGQRIP